MWDEGFQGLKELSNIAISMGSFDSVSRYHSRLRSGSKGDSTLVIGNTVRLPVKQLLRCNKQTCPPPSRRRDFGGQLGEFSVECFLKDM